MTLPYFHVDAFTGHVFSGNPAGVCLLADWLEDERLQAISLENQLSETAFIVPRGDGYLLRWFTPEAEVDLCGHATLAAAHVIYQHLASRADVLRFETLSGELRVCREEDRLVLDFPSRPARPCEMPEALAMGLGAAPVHVAGSRDLLSVFETEEEVRSLRPDMQILRELEFFGVIATAPGKDCDFVSRFFAPKMGVPEDPVTGSAHCTLIPYWAGRLGKTKLKAWQISARGGELSCEDRGERVRIGGRAVTYMSGFLHLS